MRVADSVSRQTNKPFETVVTTYNFLTDISYSYSPVDHTTHMCRQLTVSVVMPCAQKAVEISDRLIIYSLIIFREGLSTLDCS